MLLPLVLGSSPHLPVSVCGTGISIQDLQAFLVSVILDTSLLYFTPHHGFPLPPGFARVAGTPLAPGSPFPASAFLTCPHSSVIPQYRNLHLLSIGYDSRPRLRPRLTQSRSALLWKPWIFGLEDSHLYLATHSGILSSMQSTAPFGTASFRMQCSSTNLSVP